MVNVSWQDAYDRACLLLGQSLVEKSLLLSKQQEAEPVIEAEEES
jgi:hypothetical protein